VSREEIAAASPEVAWPVLERFGSCLLPGFAESERCLAVGRETRQFLDRLLEAASASGESGGSFEGCYWQRGPGRFQSYDALAAADRPVVNIRGQAEDVDDWAVRCRNAVLASGSVSPPPQRRPSFRVRVPAAATPS